MADIHAHPSRTSTAATQAHPSQTPTTTTTTTTHTPSFPGRVTARRTRMLASATADAVQTSVEVLLGSVGFVLTSVGLARMIAGVVRTRLPVALTIAGVLGTSAMAFPARASTPPQGEITARRGESSATFAVTGVKKNDRLTIRAEPNASAPAVGAIPANGVGIRALGPVEQRGRATWRKVAYSGAEGWVNTRFLVAEKSATTGLCGLDDDAERCRKTVAEPLGATTPSQGENRGTRLRCAGTEPFWRLNILNSKVELDQLGDKSSFDAKPPKESSNHNNLWAVLFIAPRSSDIGIAFIERTGRCSDDASDRRYPFTLRARLPDGLVISGCCEGSIE